MICQSTLRVITCEIASSFKLHLTAIEFIQQHLGVRMRLLLLHAMQ